MNIENKQPRPNFRAGLFIWGCKKFKLTYFSPG
jgi:hypothetical protein